MKPDFSLTYETTVTRAGADVIGTGRAADREKMLEFGAHQFVDLENDDLARWVGSTWWRADA